MGFTHRLNMELADARHGAASFSSAIVMILPLGPKILVAEDDPAMLDLVSRWLEAAGYGVIKVRNGEEVIRAVSEAAPAAIVMDVTMPQMDGFEVLAKLRALRRPLPPVLLLTGRQAADDVRKAVSLGARDYLTKPVERAHLLSRLERMLRAAKPPPASDLQKKPGGSTQYVD
jgi:DNA-binding response OmpR family regulator